MLVVKVSSVNFRAEQNCISFVNIQSPDTMRESLQQLIQNKSISSLNITRESANKDHPGQDVFEIRVTREMAELGGTEVPSKNIFRMPPNASNEAILSKIVNSLNTKLLPLIEGKCNTVLSVIQKSVPRK